MLRRSTRGVSTTNASSPSRAIALRAGRMWVNFFGPDPAYHEAPGASSSKGILRRKGAKRRLRQRPRRPLGSLAGAALASMGVISVF